MDEKLKKEIIRIVQDEVKTQLKAGLFTARKLTDTPTDALSVVNRNYVNLNGTTRPASPVTGQQFFDTALGQPIFWNGATWINAAGSAV